MTLSAWLRDYLYIPARRQPPGRRPHVRQPDADDAARRAVARRELELRPVGRAPRRRARRPQALQNGLGKRISVPLRSVSWVVTLGFVALCWIPFRAPRLRRTRYCSFAACSRCSGRDAVAGADPRGHRPRGSCAPAGSLAGEPETGRPAGAAAPASVADARLDEDPIRAGTCASGTRTALGMFVVSLWVLLVILSAETHARPFIYFQF